MFKREVIIVGGFHEIIELCEECQLNIIGIVDKIYRKEYRGYKVLGGDEVMYVKNQDYNKIPIIITPDLPAERKKLTVSYLEKGYSLWTLASPYARISKSANIGNGVVIQSGVNISSEVSVGDCVKINNNCNLMHNTQIGRFSTVAPNAVLLGNVEVGEECYIGANSTILPNIHIDNCSIVGAGSVVIKSIESNSIYAGNPARKLKQFGSKEELYSYMRSRQKSHE